VTEDGSHNAVTDAGADQADDTNGDSTDVPEPLNPDDVSSVYWIKQQPLPYPTVSTKYRCANIGAENGVTDKEL
jgi:hypothetical protein